MSNTELKFRVFNKTENKIEGIFDIWSWADYMYMSNCLVFEKDKYLIQQYTGMKDRYNKEIYVGDKLQVTLSEANGFTGIVVLKDGSFNLENEKKTIFINPNFVKII